MMHPRTPIAAVVTVLLLAASAGAAVIRVPGDFVTVSNAVAAAVDGDVIQLAGNGGATYPILDQNIDKDITIQGGWRIDFQTRSPDLYVSVLRDTTNLYERPVIRVLGDARLVLDGVQIYGGRFGVLADGGADLTLRDCTIRAQRNTVANPGVDTNIGTAVRMVGGTLLMERCRVEGTRSSFPGGGLGLVGVASARVVDTVLRNTLASTIFGDASGAGIYARDVGQLDLVGSRLEGCATVQRGGGLYALRTPVTATGCEFIGGLGSTAGGGIHFDSCPVAEVEDCVFRGNRATQGGGIYAVDTDLVSVSGSSFTDQQAFGDGAAMRLERSDFALDRCDFEHNHLDAFPVVVSDRGGSVYVTVGSGSVNACSFTDEKADGKGGAWAQVGGITSFTDCRFDRCSAGVFGGAVQIELSGRVEMTRCLVADSAARFGGAVCASFTADIDMTHCTIVGSTSGSAGAAAYLDTGSTIRFTDSIAVAALRGDQFYCGEGTLSIRSSNVWNDDAVNPRGEYGGLCADATGQEGTIREDPVLCPGDPDYAIASGSPCEGTASDGTDMGWRPVGCAPPGPLGVEPSSWGRIKSLYRGD